MESETSWHRYCTILRHCQSVYFSSIFVYFDVVVRNVNEGELHSTHKNTHIRGRTASNVSALIRGGSTQSCYSITIQPQMVMRVAQFVLFAFPLMSTTTAQVCSTLDSSNIFFMA